MPPWEASAAAGRPRRCIASGRPAVPSRTRPSAGPCPTGCSSPAAPATSWLTLSWSGTDSRGRRRCGSGPSLATPATTSWWRPTPGSSTTTAILTAPATSRIRGGVLAWRGPAGMRCWSPCRATSSCRSRSPRLRRAPAAGARPVPP
ncbi:hypothetical protein VP06_08900 [Methylobacterium aquaticum]|uniref:Uncharacterized protein n=1 Tax=Methylobacterium aquaticum TaxID=270351 RepID=A0A0J6SNZ6_9HYPH|nr:hypothetical protein VP06_08900 [Methylobacterium aquaticum]